LRGAPVYGDMAVAPLPLGSGLLQDTELSR